MPGTSSQPSPDLFGSLFHLRIRMPDPHHGADYDVTYDLALMAPNRDEARALAEAWLLRGNWDPALVAQRLADPHATKITESATGFVVCSVRRETPQPVDNLSNATAEVRRVLTNWANGDFSAAHVPTEAAGLLALLPPSN